MNPLGGLLGLAVMAVSVGIFALFGPAPHPQAPGPMPSMVATCPPDK